MPKYVYVWICQANYGDGWEDNGASLKWSEMREQVREYRENTPEYRHRIIRRRVTRENYEAGTF